jgi:hypothetical protein
MFSILKVLNKIYECFFTLGAKVLICDLKVKI